MRAISKRQRADENEREHDGPDARLKRRGARARMAPGDRPDLPGVGGDDRPRDQSFAGVRLSRRERETLQIETRAHLSKFVGGEHVDGDHVSVAGSGVGDARGIVFRAKGRDGDDQQLAIGAGHSVSHGFRGCCGAGKRAQAWYCCDGADGAGLEFVLPRRKGIVEPSVPHRSVGAHQQHAVGDFGINVVVDPTLAPSDRD